MWQRIGVALFLASATIVVVLIRFVFHI